MSAGEDVSRWETVGCLYAVEEEHLVGGGEENYAGAVPGQFIFVDYVIESLM